MRDYCLILSDNFQFQDKEIILTSYDEQFKEFDKYMGIDRNNSYVIKPLHEIEDRSPKWWKDYTSLKHDRMNNIQSATLESLINSMGSVFILLAIKNEALFKDVVVPSQVYNVFFPLFWEKRGMRHLAVPGFK